MGIDFDDEEEALELAVELPSEVPPQRPGGAHQQERDHREERESARHEVGPGRHPPLHRSIERQRLALPQRQQPMQLECEQPEPVNSDGEEVAEEQRQDEQC